MTMPPSALHLPMSTSATSARTSASEETAGQVRTAVDHLLRHAREPRRVARRPAGSRPSLALVSQGVRVLFGWHRPLVGVAGLMVLWGGAAVVAARLDHRRLDGAGVWTKPIKFTISLGLYAVTLAWMLSMVTKPSLRRVGWWAGASGAVACTFEMAMITLQAVRGRRSHFNVATRLDSRLYLVMALALPAFYGVTVVIGSLLTVFSRPGRSFDRSLLWALRSGLVIGVSGLTIGFRMGRPTPDQQAEARPSTVGSHSVGGDDPSGGLPFLGWNTRHGDLRVPHFVGMHALQGLPLIALTLRGLAGGAVSEGTRTRIVLTAAAAWAALTGTAMQQALRGRPVTRVDGITAALLAGTGGLASVTAAAIRRRANRARRSVRLS